MMFDHSSSDHSDLESRLDDLGRTERAEPGIGFESRVVSVSSAFQTSEDRMPGRRRPRVGRALMGVLAAALIALALLPRLTAGPAPAPSSPSTTDADLLLASFDLLDDHQFAFDSEIDVLSAAMDDVSSQAGTLAEESALGVWDWGALEASL